MDVGGGQRAHPRADVTVDKYVVDNYERAGAAALDFSRPLVVADAERLPFADATFAYVIASHVLEHANDPVQFAAELSRVGAAGFVQVPSRDSELVFGWPFHPWLVDLDSSGLRFAPKPGGVQRNDQSMHDAFAESALLRIAWLAHRSRWQHSVHWERNLAVSVTGAIGAHSHASVDVEATIAAVASITAPRALAAGVRASLRCPICRAALADQNDRLGCSECSVHYPVVNEVPILLAEAASRI